MNIDNLIIIMNGSGSARLDRDYIREFCNKDSQNYYLLVNGSLAQWQPSINENCIFLIGDPIMFHMMTFWNEKWDFNDFYQEITEKFPYMKDFDFKNGLHFDYLSLKYLYTNAHVDIYSIYKLTTSVFQNKIINTHMPKQMFRLSNLFYRKNHQNGTQSSRFRIAIHTWPDKYHKYIGKSTFLAKLWYNINFMQTPNSFYNAIDFGLRKNVNNIFFCGRNSDIYLWKEQIKKQGFFVYGYFFADETEKIGSSSTSNLDNEIKFSRAYFRMLKGLFPKVNFFCIEKGNKVFAEFEAPKEHFINRCVGE